MGAGVGVYIRSEDVYGVGLDIVQASVPVDAWDA